jgi:anti-anti-sigma regulatory factor
VVVLEPEPRLYAQLDGLIDTVRENSNQDVVLDFPALGMLTTSGISRLMRLRSLLDGSGRRLILCRVRTAVKGVFAITGPGMVLEFAERRDDALSAIRPMHNAHLWSKWMLHPISQ